MLISNITDLVDLLGARAFSEASTEFSNHKRKAETLGILDSGANSVLVPGFALSSVGDLRLTFTSDALVGGQLTAVGMVVQDVLVRADLATRRLLETDLEDVSTLEANLIWEGNGLEPHLLLIIVGLSLLEDLLVERRKIGLVEVAGDEEHRVLGGVTGEWLVKRVVADNVLVLGEASGNVVPVVNELVSDTVLVVEEVSEGSHRLLGHVVSIEIAGLAVLDQGIVVFIFSELSIVKIPADAELLVDLLESPVHEAVDAMSSALDQIFGVEVREAFTAHGTGENVLMHIDKGVDASISKLVDHSLNSVKVSVVVDTLGALDGLPHDSESDEVHTPLLEEIDILVVERVLRVERSGGRNIRVNLVYDVDTVEQNLTAVLVDHGAVGRVDVDSLGTVGKSVGSGRGIRGTIIVSDRDLEGSKGCCGENSGTEAESFERHSLQNFYY